MPSCQCAHDNLDDLLVQTFFAKMTWCQFRPVLNSNISPQQVRWAGLHIRLLRVPDLQLVKQRCLQRSDPLPVDGSLHRAPKGSNDFARPQLHSCAVDSCFIKKVLNYTMSMFSEFPSRVPSAPLNPIAKDEFGVDLFEHNIDPNRCN
jgi:hypothetical protein